ncbi:hypothetical protein [Streptomyces syringium]|uniref:hypothetical protein n=1 Tax=Streptomyces syringium TaxID=76729 RepID=UPI0037D4BFEC
MGGCTGQPRCRTCHRCGTIGTHLNQWRPPTDSILELLGENHTPSPWFRVWQEAARRFGQDIAHHLAQVTTEIDQTHLYGHIAFRGSVLAIRHGARGFAAASDCPRTECRRGRVWTPVRIREDLLNVRLNGPGPGASECDRAADAMVTATHALRGADTDTDVLTRARQVALASHDHFVNVAAAYLGNCHPLSRGRRYRGGPTQRGTS